MFHGDNLHELSNPVFLKKKKKKKKRITNLSSAELAQEVVKATQQTHNVATKSLQRRCNVTTLQRRCNDVVVTLGVCWVRVKMTTELEPYNSVKLQV